MPDDKQLSIVYSNVPTLIKLGFLSVNRQHIPKWCALISFLICNFQTIELLLNNSNLYLTSPSNKGSTLIEAYLQLFSFSHRFSYTNCVPILIWAGVMLAYCLHFLILFLYLSIKLKKKSSIPDYIQKYWSIINYFHPLIFFFPIHTFNLQVLQANRLDTFIEPIKTPIMIIFYMNIIINFLLAFSSTRFFHVLIKTKDLLSSKESSIRTNDVLSKTLISILWMFADDREFMPAFTLVIAAIDCCFRDITLFYYLPYYSTQILEISALMQGATTCLSLLTLLAKVLAQTNLHLGQYFIHVAWVIMIPLGAKLYHSFLRKLFEYITSVDKSKISLHYALHQVILLKNLAKTRLAPNSETRIFNLPYLIFQAIIAKDEKSVESGDKSQILKATRAYYIGVVSKSPRSHIAKVTLANHYVKKESAYLLANNLIEEVLNDAPSFSMLVSLCLIRFELQKKTFLEYSQKGESQAQSLNLLHYVEVNRLGDQLKKKIKHQIRKQLEFWENFSSKKPDMGLLTQLALDVELKKKAVEKAWKELSKSRPSTFYSPPLVFGMYVSLANNNTVEGEKIIDQYHTDILKTSRLMDVDELNNNTIMAEDTVQISMSVSRTKIGYILDCSSNISEVYGWKKEFLTKQPIITIMPPYYQQKHNRFLMNHYNTGKTKLLNNTSLLPVVGSDGYIRPSRVHIKMHPFVEQGISYIAVLRKLKEPRRMVLIRKDGTIDGMSKNFAVDMNIGSKDQLKNLMIFNLCPEFRSVNSAFNAKALKTIDIGSVGGDQLGPLKDADTELGRFLSDNGLSNNEDSSKNINSSTRNLHSTSEKVPTSYIGIDAKVQNIYDSFTAGFKLTFYPPQAAPARSNKIKFLSRSKPIHDPSNSVLYNVQITTRIHGKEFIKVVYLDRIITEDDESSHDLPSEHRRQRSSRTPTPVAKDQSPQGSKFDMTTACVSSSRALLSPSAAIAESKVQDILNEKASDMASSRGMTIPEESAHSEAFDHNMSTLRQNFVKRGHSLEKKESNKENNVLKKRKTLAAGDLTKMKLLGLEKPRLAKIIGQFIQATRKGQNIFEAKSQSISEGHKTQPLQAENLLRKKLRKLRKRLDRGGAIEVEREGSVATSSFSRGKKVQGLILKALDLRTYSKSTILFCAGFFLFNLIVLALQTWESLNILSAVNNITTKTDVVENGVFRLDSFLNLGLYARIWYESLDSQNMTNSLTSETLAYELQVYTDDTNNYNTLLIEQVTQIDSSYQKDFYEQNIRMYENGTLIGSYSNFAASNLMINHAIQVLSKQESSNYTSTDTSDLQFIVDNIYDDFLVSCEETISLLTTDLNSILSDTDTETLVIFCFVIAINVIFLFIVLKYFHSVHKESNRFSNLIFRLNLKEAQEVKSILQNFIHSLGANVHDIEDINEKHEIQENVKSEEASTGKVKFRRASTSNLLKRQIFMFLRLLSVFTVVIAWTLSYFVITKNILTKIQEQQAQIEYSLMILYRQNLVIAEFIELLSTDSTATVRNVPIQDSLLSDLSNLQDVGNIISQFMDKDGNLKTDEYKVFFDFPCADFVNYDLQLTDSLVSNCILLSDGTGKTSFSKISTLMHSAIMDYYAQLIGDSWTEDQLDEAYKESLSDFMSLALVAPALCKILYLTNAIDFYVQIDNAKSSATVFSVVTIIGIAASAIVVWFYVIKKILRLETYYKLILKLVPVPSILNNQHLKNYLIQNSNNILDNVISFLER